MEYLAQDANFIEFSIKFALLFGFCVCGARAVIEGLFVVTELVRKRL